jgi:acyl dehydratase
MANQQTALGAAVGDEIPPFTRATGLDIFNRYAAVNYEFVPIHMDDDEGRKAGYPRAFGMGNLSTAYLLNVLREWIGEEGTIRSLSIQFRRANLKDTTVTARGTVTAIRDEEGDRVIDLEVWTEDDEGRLAPGSATVSVPLA